MERRAVERRQQLQNERTQQLQQRREFLQQQRDRAQAKQRELSPQQSPPQRAFQRDRGKARDQAQQPATPQQAAPRTATVTPQAATQGRFSARFRASVTGPRPRLAATMLAPQRSWRRGRHATFVAWLGPVFWPYAYSDIFHFAFWPDAYDDGYWAYAYDDIFEVAFWADGSPYADDAYAGPYAGLPGARGHPRARAARTALAEVCEPDKGITAWPFARIQGAVQPDAEQIKLLDELKDAAVSAAARFAQACPRDVPMTPPGRLRVMILRLEATLEAIRIVRAPLEAFYDSLSDEQKARFNAVGPKLDVDQASARNRPAKEALCGPPKPGLVDFPIEQIRNVISPEGKQAEALDRLGEATRKAVGILQDACPDFLPQTPVGRLQEMESRISAMLKAGKIIEPALADFYAALSNEQKARFNTLGREARDQAG
jgi:hypothetical protein